MTLGRGRVHNRLGVNNCNPGNDDRVGIPINDVHEIKRSMSNLIGRKVRLDETF